MKQLPRNNQHRSLNEQRDNPALHCRDTLFKTERGQDKSRGRAWKKFRTKTGFLPDLPHLSAWSTFPVRAVCHRRQDQLALRRTCDCHLYNPVSLPVAQPSNAGGEDHRHRMETCSTEADRPYGHHGSPAGHRS